MADVPATVVEEIAKNETLQAQLEVDVPTIDVTELVESLSEKQAEEKALEEQAQETVEAAIIVQEEAIAAEISDTAEAGDTEQTYVDLNGNTATPTESDTSDSSSDDSGSTVDDDTSGGSSDSGSSMNARIEVSDANELQSTLNNNAVVYYTGFNYGNYERQSSDCIACGQCDSVCPPLTIISFLRDGEFSATKDYCLFV